MFPNFLIKNNLAFNNKCKDYYPLKKGWSCTATIYNQKKKIIHFDCYGKEKDRGKKS